MFIVCSIFAPIIGLYLAWCLYRLSIKHRIAFVLYGVALFAAGCWLYGGSEASPIFQVHGLDVCDTSEVTPALSAASDSVVRPLAAMNKSLSSFFPSRGGYDDEELWTECKTHASPASCHRVAYWVFHTLAILYMLSMFIAIFGVELGNKSIVCLKIRIWPWLQSLVCQGRRAKPMCVFWGADDESLVLCSAVANGVAGDADIDIEHSVFILPESTRSWLRLKDDDGIVYELTRRGWLWVMGDASSPGSLKMARKHFFLGSDGHKNVAQAELLISIVKGLKNLPRGGVVVYVRAWTEADDDALYRWSDGLNAKLANEGVDIVVEVIREEATVSRKFLIDNPMLDCPGIELNPDATVSGAFRLLVVGFGVQGERLMGDMICDAQYLSPADGSGKRERIPMHIDVVDRSSASFGWFKGNCQSACDRYDIHFEEMDACGDRFWDWLGKKPDYNRVVICTQSDVTNLGLANDIANHYGSRFMLSPAETRKRVFSRVRNHQLAVALKYSDSPYRIFGDIADTYSPLTLLNDKWDDGAKKLIGVYCGCGKEEEYEKCWRVTSMFDKESTRAALFHLRNIMRLIGYEVKDMGGMSVDGTSDDDTEKLPDCMQERIEKRKDVLAESEHLRWCAFHFVRGWATWRVVGGGSDETRLESLAEEMQRKGVEKCVEANTLKKRGFKLHADLVEYAELDEKDAVFNEINLRHCLPLKNKRTKDKDVDIVRGVCAIRKARFRISKYTEKEG